MPETFFKIAFEAYISSPASCKTFINRLKVYALSAICEVYAPS